VLDAISGGRFILGVGRGVAKIEFDAFKVDMNQTRDLLIDNIKAIRMGLEQGYIELDGRVLKQPRALIRPKPSRSFANRLYGSAQSPETFPLFGELGIGLLFIPGAKPWQVVADELGSYREAFRQHHQREAPPPIFSAWVFVDEDEARAKELGRKYIGSYVMTALNHYNVHGSHLKGVKGYESYVAQAEADAAAGVTLDGFLDTFVGNHVFGTPEQCYEQIRDIRGKTGAAGFLGVFNYAGMGEAEAVRNQELFAAKVLPRLKALEPGLDIWSPDGMALAAE
jgi:alkanesulfonate monooxygenase SsuD/methylene tetrahydromethanopterin reductase-like flavin-dependent oxidoreductase (luciferase family)